MCEGFLDVWDLLNAGDAGRRLFQNFTELVVGEADAPIAGFPSLAFHKPTLIFIACHTLRSIRHDDQGTNSEQCPSDSFPQFTVLIMIEV